MQISKSKEDRYYKALVDRDPSYLGSFIVGVKSTSIFCISTCRARKPLRKNVVFFEGAREALAAGFRPCKVCRPTESGAPEMVERVMNELRSHPMEKIRDADLRAMGIAPERLRRCEALSVVFRVAQRRQEPRIKLISRGFSCGQKGQRVLGFLPLCFQREGHGCYVVVVVVITMIMPNRPWQKGKA